MLSAAAGHAVHKQTHVNRDRQIWPTLLREYPASRPLAEQGISVPDEMVISSR
jgi:hypothetical protein